MIVENLELQFSASDKNALAQIGDITRGLSALSRAVGKTGDLPVKLNILGESLSNFVRNTAGVSGSGISDLAFSLSALAKAKLNVETFTNNAEAIRVLDSAVSSMGGDATPLVNIAGALQTLSASRKGLTNLDKIANGITALGDSVFYASRDVDIKTVSDFVSALGSLSQVKISSAGFSRAAESIGTLATSLNQIDGAKLSTVSDALRSVADATKEVNRTTKETAKAVKESGSAWDELKKKLNLSQGSFNKFMKSFGRIAFYRATRTAIKSVTDAFDEGTKNAYHFSEAVGYRLASKLDELASVSFKLKNQLGSAFAEVLASVTPILKQIASYAIAAADAISQFFAALNGSSTYLKAVDYAKQWDDATKAAKKYQNTILGFDEINRLNAPSTGSGAGGDNYAEMFEITDVSGKIAKIAEYFKEIDLSSTSIKAALGLAAGAIASMLVGLPQVAGVLGGLAISITGITFEYDAIKNIATEGLNAADLREAILGGIASVLGLGIAGASIAGASGALIGSLAGLFISVGVGVKAYLDGTYEADVYGAAFRGGVIGSLLLALAGAGLGAAVGAKFGGLAGAGTGAIIGAIGGLVVGVGIAVSAYLDDSRRDYIESSQLAQDVIKIQEELQSFIDEQDALTVRLKQIKVDIDNAEVDLAYKQATKLIDKLFEINDKEINTPAEMELIKTLVDEINNLGFGELIQNFDELSGKVKTSKDEALGLLQANYELIKQEGLRELYTEAIKAQAEAEFQLEKAKQGQLKTDELRLAAVEEYAAGMDRWLHSVGEYSAAVATNDWDGYNNDLAENTANLINVKSTLDDATDAYNAFSEGLDIAQKNLDDANESVKILGLMTGELTQADIDAMGAAEAYNQVLGERDSAARAYTEAMELEKIASENLQAASNNERAVWQDMQLAQEELTRLEEERMNTPWWDIKRHIELGLELHNQKKKINELSDAHDKANAKEWEAINAYDEAKTATANAAAEVERLDTELGKYGAVASDAATATNTFTSSMAGASDTIKNNVLGNVAEAKKALQGLKDGLKLDMSTITNAVSTINTAIRTNKTDALLQPNTSNVPKYAEGGYPEQGSLFIAGERGAELVSSGAGGTSVSNQNQIADAVNIGNRDVVNAVYAMASMITKAVEGKDSNVYLSGRELARELYPFTQALARNKGNSLVVRG